MKTIEIKTYNSNERVHVKPQAFTIAFNNRRGEESIRTVYATDFADEGIILMQYGAMIKASYSAEEIAEIDRLNSLEPVRNGDIVSDKNGKQYRVTINGDYSDAGKLTAI